MHRSPSFICRQTHCYDKGFAPAGLVRCGGVLWPPVPRPEPEPRDTAAQKYENSKNELVNKLKIMNRIFFFAFDVQKKCFSSTKLLWIRFRSIFLHIFWMFADNSIFIILLPCCRPHKLLVIRSNSQIIPQHDCNDALAYWDLLRIVSTLKKSWWHVLICLTFLDI